MRTNLEYSNSNILEETDSPEHSNSSTFKNAVFCIFEKNTFEKRDFFKIKFEWNSFDSLRSFEHNHNVYFYAEDACFEDAQLGFGCIKLRKMIGDLKIVYLTAQ